MKYEVDIVRFVPRTLAIAAETIPVSDVPRRYAELLDRVYLAGRTHALTLDGQNIFVYTNDAGRVMASLGVGVRAPFDAVDGVAPFSLPSCQAVHTRHTGDYSGIRAANGAIQDWFAHSGRAKSGMSWEIYGHWSDDPAQRHTDIYYQLAAATSA